MIYLVIAAYFVVGAGMAAYRAYLDPIMFERECEENGRRITHRSRTLFYNEAVTASLLAWPIMGAMLCVRASVEVARERGVRAVEERKRAAQQRLADEAAIDRIIKENAL